MLYYATTLDHMPSYIQWAMDRGLTRFPLYRTCPASLLRMHIPLLFEHVVELICFEKWFCTSLDTFVVDTFRSFSVCYLLVALIFVLHESSFAHPLGNLFDLFVES